MMIMEQGSDYMELKNLKKIGPKTIDGLNKMGIFNIEDLLEYYPYRYNIWSVSDINNAKKEENIVIKGIIESEPRVNFIRKNLNRLTFKLNTGIQLINVTIFNRGYLKKNLSIGKMILLVGKYNQEKNTFIASDIKLDLINTSEIEPVYHLINGIKNKNVIGWVKESLTYINIIDDYIPKYLVEKYNFISKSQAITNIHQPNDSKLLKYSRLRLIYEELFIFMFKISILSTQNKLIENGIKRDIKKSQLELLITNLPFQLTVDQIKCIDEIIDDLNAKTKMNRLVLGDVGSGKTVVAIVAMYANYLSKHQSALMAPTEILATQHYYNIKELLKDTDIAIELLVGSQTKKEKENIASRLETGEIDIIIGTHALINSEIFFDNLGLVITDEQHRFGVNQRGLLQSKGKTPDIIYLSATPIPRTYALTLYGDMSVSIIKAKPNGRKQIATKVVKENDIKEVLTKVLQEINAGHQVYVVSPIIEESEDNELKDVNLLKEKFELAFNNRVKIGILHGKLKNVQKEAIMNDFKNGIINILISTTVIEVGVDVKNATTMIIFNAERFGLATLHQLRGRVGRNDFNAYCYLICNKEVKRLGVLEESNDGFYISEKDFELRGEGDLFGTKQSGDMTFKLADLKRDYKILLQAKNDAEEFINNNIQDNFINNEKYKKIIEEMTLN